ncbi:5263_t:CDS:2, partial [Gigaspora margarita]
CSQVTSEMGVQNNTKKIAAEKTLKWFTEVQQTLAEEFYLFGREQTTLTITKQFPEITQELWSLYQSLRIPKTVRVNLIIINNVEIVGQIQSIASWEIMNTGIYMSLTARTWPSPLKNALIAIRSLGACLKENKKPNRKTQFNSDHTSSNDYIELQTNTNRKQVEQRSNPTTFNPYKNNKYK